MRTLERQRMSRPDLGEDESPGLSVWLWRHVNGLVMSRHSDADDGLDVTDDRRHRFYGCIYSCSLLSARKNDLRARR